MLRPLAILFTLLTLTPLALAAAPKARDLVHATLLADTSAVTPGKPFTAAVYLKIAPGWHVYWKNPGDSGQATSLSFDLPAAFQLSPTQFPLPTRFSLPGDLTNFGYENELLLTTTITPPADLLTPKDGLHVNATLSFLVCSPDQCLPGKHELSLTLPLSEPQPANEELLNRWRPLFPTPANKIATIKTTTTPPTYTIDITWASPATKLEFFPGPAPSLNIANTTLSSASPTETTLTFTATPLSKDEPSSQKTLDSLLTYTTPDGSRHGIELPVPLIAETKPSTK